MTLKNFTLTIAALAALFTPVAAQAQVTLTKTTTASAIGTPPASGVSCFNVTSATNIVAPSFGSPNVPTGNQTELYTDKEAMLVTSVSGTYVCALRGYSSTVAVPHVSGSDLYVGSPSQFSFNEKAGACTATVLPEVPVINVTTGHIFSCGTSGQWVQLLNGTQTGAQSGTINFACTGTVGSAETEYISSTLACSGSTSELVRWVASSNGTVANFRAYSSAAFVGTGGSIFTVRKNGSAVTGFTCAPTATHTKCVSSVAGGPANDGTVGAVNSVLVVPGDVITVSFLSATSDTAANIAVSLDVY